MTSSHTIRTTAAAALLALSMSAPALAQQDLRGPDARDAARTSEIARQIRHFAATSQPPAAAPAPQPAAPAPQPAAVTGVQTPWLPIALMGGFSLAVVVIAGAYVVRLRRRAVGALS
jgi:hypothetical protein